MKRPDHLSVVPEFPCFEGISTQERDAMQSIQTALAVMLDQLTEAQHAYLLHIHSTKLYESQDPNPDPSDPDQLRRMYMSWEVIAARTVALATWEIKELLNLISAKYLQDTPHLKCHMDLQKFKSAHKLFDRGFKRSRNIRQNMAHPGKSQVGKGHESLIFSGPVKGGMVFVVDDDQYTLSISEEAMKKLEDVVTAAFSAF